jgi:hypothetical protein
VRLRAEGAGLIEQISGECGLDRLEVLKACSMVPGREGGRPRYLVSLDAASPEWLARTVQDLRDRLRTERSKRAPPEPLYSGSWWIWAAECIKRGCTADEWLASLRESKSINSADESGFREALARASQTCAAS